MNFCFGIRLIMAILPKFGYLMTQFGFPTQLYIIRNLINYNTCFNLINLSLVMKDDDTRRLLNVKLTTNTTRKAVLIELLYPTIYKFSCLLSLVEYLFIYLT